MAIMISIPAGITANQASTETLSQNLSNTITQTEGLINQALTQIDCSLTPSFSGFGFNRPSGTGVGPGGGALPSDGAFVPGSGIGQFGGGAFGGGGSTAMNETLYTDISSVSHVDAVVQTLQVSEGQNETFTAPNGMEFTRLVPDYVIKGIPLTSSTIDNYPILPTNITAGRNLQEGDTGVVVLSENNTAFFGANIGDTVTILDQPFEVVGVHGASGVEDATTLYMNLSDVQELTDNVGYITSLAVFVDSADNVTAVANEISVLHPELSVVTSQQRLDQLNAMQQTYQTQLDSAEVSLGQTQAMAVQEIVIAVAATSLIVLVVMLYTVRERTKEIGTLKAIGFSNLNIMGQFMFEGVILSFIAGVVGVAIGFVAAPVLSGLLLPAVNAGFGGAFARATGTTTSSISGTITPELVAIALGGAVLLGVLGSLYPAWRASRTSPMEALRYE
jgi:putative ABC transport system permease protein